MTDEASHGQTTDGSLSSMQLRPPRRKTSRQRGASPTQPRARSVEKILRHHPGLPRRLQSVKPTGAYKWIEELPRKVCVARKSPAHVLLRCRQLIDQSRKQVIECDGEEADALKRRLRVRMETLWEELKIPHIDRDSFLALHGGCLASLVHQVQLLVVHYQCTLRVLHCIRYREELLQQRHHEHVAIDKGPWMQSMTQVSVATVEAIEMWRDTLWLPHAFRTKHASNYLVKMTTDCSTIDLDRASCPVLAPLDPPNRATVQAGQYSSMAPTARQWRAVRTLKSEPATHMQVAAMHAQWASSDQFVPLLKWDSTPRDGATNAPTVHLRSFADTPCFVQQSWTSCVRLETVVAIATLQRRWRAQKASRRQESSDAWRNPIALPPLVSRAKASSTEWPLMRFDRIPHSVCLQWHGSMAVVSVPQHVCCVMTKAAAKHTSGILTPWTPLLPPRPAVHKAAVRRISRAWRAHHQRQLDARKQEKLRAYRDIWLNNRSHKAIASDSDPTRHISPPNNSSPSGTSSATAGLGPASTHQPHRVVQTMDPATRIQRWWRTRQHCQHVTPARPQVEPRRLQQLPGPRLSPLKAVMSRFQVWWSRFRHANEHGSRVGLDKATERRVHRAVSFIQHRWRLYLLQQAKQAKLTLFRDIWLAKRKSVPVIEPTAAARPSTQDPASTLCSSVCFRLEDWRLEPSKSSKPSPTTVFLHVQVLDASSRPVCTFQTPHQPFNRDLVEWDHVSLFVPGVAQTGATLVVTAVGVTIWKKYKFLGQVAGPLKGAAPAACHEAHHSVYLKPGKSAIVYCNDSTATSPVTTKLRWSCAPVPCRMHGHVTGFLCSLHDTGRHATTAAYFMCVLDDDRWAVYLDEHRAKPVVRVDLRCVQSCVVDADDALCLRVQFVEPHNPVRLFVFQCRREDGDECARKWAAILSTAARS